MHTRARRASFLPGSCYIVLHMLHVLHFITTLQNLLASAPIGLFDHWWQWQTLQALTNCFWLHWDRAHQCVLTDWWPAPGGTIPWFSGRQFQIWFSLWMILSPYHPTIIHFTKSPNTRLVQIYYWPLKPWIEGTTHSNPICCYLQYLVLSSPINTMIYSPNPCGFRIFALVSVHYNTS